MSPSLAARLSADRFNKALPAGPLVTESSCRLKVSAAVESAKRSPANREWSCEKRRQWKSSETVR